MPSNNIVLSIAALIAVRLLNTTIPVAADSDEADTVIINTVAADSVKIGRAHV